MRESSNLNFLRTVAVLCVAASHLSMFLHPSARAEAVIYDIGVGGVLFFFVHTSLVLFLSMERSQPEHSAVKFYVRRAFRIYPLCWVCIGFVLLTGLSDTAPGQLHEMGLHGIVVNALLIQNIVRVGNVVGPLWSLPWEVQMYVLLPALFLIITRKGKLWVPLGIWTATTMAAVAVTATNTPRAFHGVLFIPLFMGGVVAYQMRNSRRRFNGAWWPLAVFSLIVVRACLLRGDSLESAWNVFINSTTCLLLGISIPLFREFTSKPVPIISHFIAKYSYGIYLFHMPMLVLMFVTLGWLPVWMKIQGWILATGAVSFALFYLVEQPFIGLGKAITSSHNKTLVAPPRVAEATVGIQ